MHGWPMEDLIGACVLGLKGVITIRVQAARSQAFKVARLAEADQKIGKWHQGAIKTPPGREAVSKG